MKTRFFSLAFLCAIQFFAVQGSLSIASVMAQDRGFIHPGGLHTQADFDRVKAQLEKGNTKVKQAYQKLTSAAYSQSGVQTYPVETIIRGGGNGENFLRVKRPEVECV